MMFFNDIKAMVKAGIKADITALDNPSHKVRLCNCCTHLKNWLHMDFGLLDYVGDNYVNLLWVLITNPALVICGLPDASQNEMSTMAFAQYIYNVVTGPTHNPLGALILPKGTFWPIIQVAVIHIMVLAPTNPAKFVVNILHITTEHLKIHFIPYKKCHNGSGKLSHTPV
jgi:hypothetical protein